MAAGLVVLAVIVVAVAGVGPGYDPYGWLVWGAQTVHLSLDLGGAPSWKPLPALFTVPYALAGHAQRWLWMVTAVSVALAGCVLAGRIAYRLTRRWLAPEAWAWAPILAALFAAIGVLGIQDYTHYFLSGQSDPMIATFCLAAIDLHLSRRHGWALAAVVLGALGRPEVWPFLVIYATWAWLKVPGMRYRAVVGVLVVPGLWFGVPWITNGRPDVAGQLAMNTRQVLHRGQVSATVRQFTHLEYLPVWLAALLALVIGGTRRRREVVFLAAGVVLWVAVEVVLALRSFPVLPRFMFESAAVAAVLAGIGVGLAVSELPKLWSALPRWSGIAVAIVLAAILVPDAVARIDAERIDLRNEHDRSTQIQRLQATIHRLGGYRVVRSCGEPVTHVAYASALAWLTQLDVDHVGYKPARERRRRYPTVIFLPLRAGGWEVQPWHIRRAQRSSCARLRASFLPSADSPLGRLVHSRVSPHHERRRRPAARGHRRRFRHQGRHRRRRARRLRSRSRFAGRLRRRDPRASDRRDGGRAGARAGHRQRRAGPHR